MIMPTARSLFLLLVMTLFAGFALTVGGWAWAAAVSAIGSIGVLWFHFSFHFGPHGKRWRVWPQHFILVIFIIANLLRGLGVGFASVLFILLIAAILANVFVSAAPVSGNDGKNEVGAEKDSSETGN
jgi:hypothetical protein